MKRRIGAESETLGEVVDTGAEESVAADHETRV
jgi:hypothetical protein